jgi:hypothetical protein
LEGCISYLPNSWNKILQKLSFSEKQKAAKCRLL